MKLGRSLYRVLAPWAPAGFCEFVTISIPVFAAAAGSRSAGLDPAVAAQQVFQGQDFWWKRLKTQTVSSSWFDSLVEAVMKAVAWIVRQIGELLAKLLRSLFSLLSGSTSTGGTVGVWLIVAAILAFAIWKLGPVFVRWLTDRGPVPGNRESVTWETLAEPSALFEQAGQAFRDGMYADAIRLALLALIARLQKQGLLRHDATRTNREYLMDLRNSSDLAASFGQLARIYERVWYGRMPAGRGEAETAIRLCASVISREELAPE